MYFIGMIDIEVLARLKKLRKLLGKTQTEFAEGIGIKQASYSLIEKGQRSLTDRCIHSIVMAYDVNEEWIRTGEGPIFANTQLRKELLDIFCTLSEPSQKYALRVLRELKELQDSK